MPDQDGISTRVRTLEEHMIRTEERGKTWDKCADSVLSLSRDVQSIWAEIGQLKVKNGLIWAAVAVIGGIVSSVLTSFLISKFATP